MAEEQPTNAPPMFPSNHVVYDSDGAACRMALLDGHMVPPFGEDKFRRVRDTAVRDDDVFLIGYPKTGCHWTWEILRMIVNKKADITRTGKGESFMELVEEGALEAQQGRRVLNSHLWWEYLPSGITEKKSKIVFTIRNPKDTCTSFYNHHINLKGIYDYQGTFKAWFSMFMDGNVDYGSFQSYHEAWHEVMRAHPAHPFYVVCYENMKEDLPREIRHLAKFLDIELDEGTVRSIAAAAGFDRMKEQYDGNGSLSSRLLRKGQVGDWQQWLTVAQSRALDDVDRALAHTQFKFRYSI